MKKELGLLNRDEEKVLGKVIAEKIPFKNPIFKVIKKPVFIGLIRTVDDLLLEKVPDNWKNPLKPIISALIDGDKDKASKLGSKLINKHVDVPGIDEEKEQALINSLLQLILYAICEDADVDANFAPPPPNPPPGGPPRP